MTNQTQIYDKDETQRLVLAVQAGDREAMGELYTRYERHVFSIAYRRLSDWNEAQELVQDVFMQAMQKIDQLRDPACFAGWLRAITHRMAINRAVRRAPDIATEPETLAATCIGGESPLDAVMENERASEVHAGLSRLGELDRETLVAFYVKGQSLIEMAGAFDAPVGTIKRRLHVARKRLAQQVEDRIAV
jgi:RNA polymerase sigma-70 factor (ECF subfamily)